MIRLAQFCDTSPDTLGQEAEVPQAWPRLQELGLSEAAKRVRSAGIGGSDANIILSGSPDRIVRLWQEKRGEFGSEDLSDVLPVMLGQWTEAFNRQWYERLTGQTVEDVGMVASSDHQPWRRATLDGFVASKRSVWEAKHVNAFAKPEEVLAKYMPQLQHNMAVLGVENAILSVIYGNHKWEAVEIAADWLYQDELLAAEQEFWTCVLEGSRPVPLPPPPTPKAVATREVCLEGNNAWANAAGDWVQFGDAARLHAQSAKDIKEMVEEDVTKAWGHGIEVRRSKSGALTIREQI